MRLSASVMAHPDRANGVERLLASIAPSGQGVSVHWDAEGKASGNADRVWRQARAAWMMHDPAADWHVLLQDDAMPCEDFLPGLSAALDTFPIGVPRVVSGYLGAGKLVPRRWQLLADRADEAGACWIRSSLLMWGVCIALPVASINDMIAYADRQSAIPDDMRVAGWAKRNGIEVWYAWPSLVDHAPVASLTKHRAHDRIARKVLTGSAMDIDWSGPTVADPMLIRGRTSRSAPSASRHAARMRRFGQ